MCVLIRIQIEDQIRKNDEGGARRDCFIFNIDTFLGPETELRDIARDWAMTLYFTLCNLLNARLRPENKLGIS